MKINLEDNSNVHNKDSKLKESKIESQKKRRTPMPFLFSIKRCKSSNHQENRYQNQRVKHKNVFCTNKAKKSKLKCKISLRSKREKVKMMEICKKKKQIG